MSSLWPSSFPLHDYTSASSCSSFSKLTLKLHSFDFRRRTSLRPRRYTCPPQRHRPVSVFFSVNRPQDIPSSSSSEEKSSISIDRNPSSDAISFSSPSSPSSSDKVFVNDIKFLQEILARLKDPFHHIFSTASKRIMDYLDRYIKPQPAEQKEEEKGRESKVDSGTSEIQTAVDEEWNWERWKRHFDYLEEQESLASILKFKLEDAIDDEDFQEAARLKVVLTEANNEDPVSEVLTGLKKALEDENYEQATRLRDEAAAGLIGWWIGLAEGENDPYGRIINISSAYGRFIAKSYTARQLVTAFPGASLFEVFVRKDSRGYHQQAVYLQRGASESRNGIETAIHVNVVDVNASDESGKSKDLIEAFGDEKEKQEDATVSTEKLRSIISFLKERIPDVKLKVYRVIKQNGEDIPKILEQIFEEVEMEGEGSSTGNNSEVSTEDAFQEAQLKAGESGISKQNLPRKLPRRLIGQKVIDEKLPQKPTRIPAKIEFRDRDSFLFHIEDTESEQTPNDTTVVKQTSINVDSETLETISNGQKISVKVSKDLEELLKLAVNQVQRQRGLSKCTAFHRIDLTNSNADALTGLYIGAFGPYTSELVQLKRKYGNWHGETDETNSDKRMEFVEFVEAVKLTGDMNVPAGQVTFRAKIGKENRLPHRGLFPEELGLIARYKGQGRLAEPGFKNPQWVDGELLLFDGKGFGSLNGAELGFVYSVPEKNFLVLFNRLKLEV